MSLTDDLSMSEWQRRRNAPRSAVEGDGVARAPLSDDMPADVWQRTRTQQVAGGGDDLLAGGQGTDGLRPTPKASAFNVDRQFIADHEGAHLDMRVPERKDGQVLGHSGPTVGGIDLGQKDMAYLKSLKLAPELTTRLSPYLGKRGVEAQAFVRAHPLVLPQQDFDVLRAAVQDKEFNKLADKFDAASQVGPFRQLPRDTQTAIASLYYQYGADAPERAAPNYWRQVTSGDWEGAHSNLLHFGDAYGPRRKDEAKRLQGDIRSGKLPRKR